MNRHRTHRVECGIDIGFPRVTRFFIEQELLGDVSCSSHIDKYAYGSTFCRHTTEISHHPLMIIANVWCLAVVQL
jgi:hypothetical protein